MSASEPLHRAVSFNCPKIIRILVKHGANINAEDGRPQTPLGLAVESSEVDATRVLLELGADMMYDNPRGLTGPVYIRNGIVATQC